MTEIKQQLFDKRVLLLDDKITIDVFHYVREFIGRLSLLDEPPELTVEITCNGGNADPGLYIYDIIRLYKGKTTGRVIGYARSMAAIILQACDIRQMTSNSYLLVHNVTDSKPNTAKDMRNKKKMQAIIKSTEAVDKKKIDILSVRTGLNPKLIIKLLEEDRDIDANEAKKLNFVDEII